MRGIGIYRLETGCVFLFSVCYLPREELQFANGFYVLWSFLPWFPMLYYLSFFMNKFLFVIENGIENKIINEISWIIFYCISYLVKW